MDSHSTLLFMTVTPSNGAWTAPFLMAIISEYLGQRLTACTRWDNSQLLCSPRSTYPCDPARNQHIAQAQQAEHLHGASQQQVFFREDSSTAQEHSALPHDTTLFRISLCQDHRAAQAMLVLLTGPKDIAVGMAGGGHAHKQTDGTSAEK